LVDKRPKVWNYLIRQTHGRSSWPHYSSISLR